MDISHKVEIKGLAELCSSSYNMNPAARRKYIAKQRNTLTIDAAPSILKPPIFTGGGPATTIHK